MRLTLDAAPSPLVVADDGSTVSGTAVPFGEIGHTSAGPVRFTPRSISVPTDYAAPFCLDHDLTRPVGVIVELVDEADRARFVAALDPVPAAEHARAQMRSGSRSGVSVSVDVLDHEVDEDGTLVVTSAELVELSSVVRPAFRSARVAAQEGETPMSDALAVEAATKTKTPDPVDPVVEPDAPARVPAHVTRSGGNVTVAPSLSAMFGGVMRQVRAAGELDGRDLRAMIEREDARLMAALADVTTAEWPPVGTWAAELDNFVRRGMPTVDAFTTRPTDRWPVFQRQIKTPPAPGKQTGEKAQIPTNATAVEWVEVNDGTYAHGSDVSVQTVEDNGEQVLTDLVELVGEYVGRLINADAVAAIDAAATAGPTDGVTLDNLGTAVGLVAGSGRLSSGLVMVAAPDAYGTVWSLTASGGPSLDRFVGAGERPTIVADPAQAAGSVLVGARSAFRTYLSPMSRLRAVAVSLLGIDVGVYRRAAFRVVDSTGLVKVTTTESP